MKKRSTNIYGVGRTEPHDEELVSLDWEARDQLLRNQLLGAVAVFMVAIGIYYICTV
jgi:hypothetical protein